MSRSPLWGILTSCWGPVFQEQKPRRQIYLGSYLTPLLTGCVPLSKSLPLSELLFPLMYNGF